MKANALLEESFKLVSGDRKDAYGDVLDGLNRIAGLWNAHLVAAGKITKEFTVIDARDVAWMMVSLKHARAFTGPHRDDNYIDAAGWAAIAGEAAARLQEAS
jgi:hypothetical protein